VIRSSSSRTRLPSRVRRRVIVAIAGPYLSSSMP
jgi:hypothetical protein